jgi:hypothetical protein
MFTCGMFDSFADINTGKTIHGHGDKGKKEHEGAENDKDP